MAAELRFNNASIGGTAVTTAEFVAGSGNLDYNTTFNDLVTADGAIRRAPVVKGGTASFKAKGNLLSLNTPVGLGVAVILKLDSVTVHSGTGLVDASYNESDYSTDLSIKLDPVVNT